MSPANRSVLHLDYVDAFGDAVYDAWRSGLNPDDVDRDRVRDDGHDGYDREECAESEVARLRRQRSRLRDREGKS